MLMTHRWYSELKPAIAAGVLFLATGSVYAAEEPSGELPDAFLGTWGVGWGPGKAGEVCKRADWQNEPFVFLVKKKDVHYWETDCKFISVKKREDVEDVRTVKIDMNCSGEGSTWKKVEVWHLENIAGEVLLFTAAISSDEGGNDFYAKVARKCTDGEN